MKKFLIILGVLLCCAFITNAQTITGTVSDASGPLSAASVVEKGVKTNGVITDENGNFRITLSGNSRTLTVSSVGHASQDVKVGANQTNVNVVLQADDQGLNAVVVVGYGTKKRVTTTG